MHYATRRMPMILGLSPRARGNPMQMHCIPSSDDPEQKKPHRPGPGAVFEGAGRISAC